MPATEEALRQVRVPLADIIAGGGSITIDDVADAAEGGDGAVTHFMQAPPREDMAQRVDNGEPAPVLGEDLRPIEGSREATGLVDEAAANGTQPLEQVAPEAPQAPVAPPADPNQRGRRGMGIRPTTRFNEKYRYSNQDFYGDRGPDIYSADALGEKLYVPRAGELPMGLFASYAQQNQAQRAENKKAIADLINGAKVRDTADPYQPAFTKLVTGWQNNFVSGIADQYGGNKDLAWREIAQPGSAANKAYLDGMATMDALGQFVKFQWADAQQYITQVMKGEINTTPEQKQRAYDVYYGIGNLKGDSAGGDFTKLLEDTEMLKRDMNTLKWIKEQALPLADKAYTKLMKEPVPETINGKRFLRMRTREEIMRDIYPMMAQEGAQVTGTDKAYVEQLLRDAIPEVKSDTYQLQSAERGGSGGGGGGAERKAGYSAEYNPISPNISANKVVVGALREAGANIPDNVTRLDSVTLFDVTSNKGFFPRARQVADGGYIHPVAIFRDKDGKLWIYGKEGREPAATLPRKTDQGDWSQGGAAAQEDEMSSADFNKLKDRVVPYDQNRGNISGAFPGLDRSEINRIIEDGISGLPKGPGTFQRRGNATQQRATMTGAAGL